MPAHKVEPEERTCPACGNVFLVGGRGRPPKTARLCSMRCQEASRTRRCRDVCKELSPTDAAYVAGIVDGEGSVMLVNRNGRPGAFLRVGISNTHLGLLEWVTKVTGVGRIYTVDNAKYGRSKKTGYSWRTHSHVAEQLLTQLLPYLIVKKPQAELAIEFERRSSGPAFRADKDGQQTWLLKMKTMNARSTRPDLLAAAQL